MDRSVPEKLLKILSAAADTVRGSGFIHVISHYDADGISSAGIVIKALMREGKEFRVTFLTTLDDSTFPEVENSDAECIVMTDLGASYIEKMDALDRKIVVLDHHTPGAEAKRVIYANPHFHGIDGMKYGCGSTMACLFAVTLNERNWDLVEIAFAGIYGDKQEIDGLNAYLLDEGTERGHILTKKGSVIPSGKLTDELFLSSEPYIRGVSGNAEGVAEILGEAGISKDSYDSELSDDKRRKLSSLIVLRLAEQGVSADTLRNISGERYLLKDRKMDSGRFAMILDGCGRNGLMGLGAAAACGDLRSLKTAEENEKEFRAEIVKNAAELDGRGLTQLSDIQWFDSSRSGMTGMLCGIAMNYMGNGSKPTFGINSTEETAKVSGRATAELLSKGVDLSVALREACKAVGGSGGGHRIASGGSFPSERKDEFIEKLNSVIAAQISAR